MWGKANPAQLAQFIVSVLMSLAALGCEHAPMPERLANQLPELELTIAPVSGGETGYRVRLDWASFDPDGQTVDFVYVVDPPVEGDTAWVHTTEHGVWLALESSTNPDVIPPPGKSVIARDYHTVVVRAVDNEGGRSAPQIRSFNTRTVAPETYVRRPVPSSQVAAQTLPSVQISWVGFDRDAPDGHGPVKYKYKFVIARDIRPDNPSVLTAGDVQRFFGKDAANRFAEWDSLPGDVTSYVATGLNPGQLYAFAIVAFDEAGAFEPRFLLDSNVLQLRPSLVALGPKITVQSPFLRYEQTTGGVSLQPSRIRTIEVPPHAPMEFTWFGTPRTGTSITGYRWVLDIENLDLTNEVPRRDESDLSHWSAWSLDENHCTVPGFSAGADSASQHFLMLEVRDDVGLVTLTTIRMVVVTGQFDRDLLVVDDMYGFLSGPSSSPYPTEAEQDSFHVAVGGFPDRLTGGTSIPGAFAGFDFDTLDYRNGGRIGIPLSALTHYKVVAWYTDWRSAGGTTLSPLSFDHPATALAYMNQVGQLNVLAAYLAMGGKVFLFGEGCPTAISLRFIVGAVPASPNAFPSDPPQVSYAPRPGEFLYDYMHLTSELKQGGDGGSQFFLGEELIGAIPYQRAFAGTASDADRTHDPRIGPSAGRTESLWAGLPRLTVVPMRGSSRLSFARTWYVSLPLSVLEDSASVIDTLYLFQAKVFDPNSASANSDGKPNATYYHGSAHGALVWFGFPLYVFAPDDARAAVRRVLEVLGLSRVRA